MKTVKDFIYKSINEMEEGLPEGYNLNSRIDFELSVVTTSKAKGEADIYVANIGGNHEKSNCHKIRFSVTNKETERQEKIDGIEIARIFFEEITKLDPEYNKTKRIN